MQLKCIRNDTSSGNGLDTGEGAIQVLHSAVGWGVWGVGCQISKKKAL